ncbi:MAG: ferrochelatase [Alphaproteobacteria bacterium]|nr:ferrochelatase [Alphaproteobacteria bacterium]MCA0448403.1 ferrochelatase [Pseudomonadota bacterium]
MGKIAVVLFNLGGPDSPEAVKPFLFNLFNDPAIINLPNPFRWLLAKLISARRAPKARGIYDLIGGSSPLLANTQAQARALEASLSDLGTVKCFAAMRYWHPLTEGAALAVQQFGPERIVLLPLYPQYSTTTTESSKRAWDRAAKRLGLKAQTRFVRDYPVEPGFVAAVAALIRPHYEAAKAHGSPRVLFSAHGLPKKVIDKGDPYQRQIEETAASVVKELAIPDLDWIVCYQSRVGPLEWIKPYTEAEIERAGRDKVPLVVVPIAFVSEHSETLVELDIEYREKAHEDGVPHYERVPTVATHPAFIEGLARLVRASLS